jgi:hypothetical protein
MMPRHPVAMSQEPWWCRRPQEILESRDEENEAMRGRDIDPGDLFGGWGMSTEVWRDDEGRIIGSIRSLQGYETEDKAAFVG